MKKNQRWKWYTPSIRKLARVMRLSLILILAFSLQLSAESLAQVQLKSKGEKVRTVLKELKKQTGYYIMFNEKDIDRKLTVDVDIEGASLEEALEQIIGELPLEYSIVDDYVLIKKRAFVAKPIEEQQDEKKIIIRGTVKDEKGQALPFAAVCFKGTTTGCVSAVDGTYELEAPDEDGLVLEISSLGYKTVEIPVEGRTQINIVLVESIQGLDEVVVTGYQTLSRERATGSFSVMNSDNIANSPNETIGGNLESLVAGVQTTIDEEGEPVITIRGKSSLTGDQDPLIVVDGFAIDGGFESINRNDVEKITVLKDAAAASIWGARAANGVIVVTTKKGSKKKGLQVSFEAYAKVSNEVDLDYANPIANSAAQLQYEMMLWQQGYGKPSRTIEDINNNMTKGSEQFQKQLDDHLAGGGTGLPNFTLNTPELQRLMSLSYQEQVKEHMLRKPVSQNYNLSIRGQGEKNQYSLSVMYNENKQAMQADRNDNILVNLRNVMQLNNWLELDFGVMTQFQNQESGGVGLTD
ncbi:MAG: carboxypeptidase-like regulatory domain-containing protein [Bacteroidales bacterium]|nr:carboxypeptidase-like regulatory domain-containing protein [Bacteroidales bacterium]